MVVPLFDIPVAKPSLPTSDALLPYLQQIDSHRYYSNYGPLALELSARMAAKVSSEARFVTTASNATSAISLALLAQQAKPRSICLLPSFTFVATVHAVLAAGLVPYFVDIDPASWLPAPDQLRTLIRQMAKSVSSLVIVAPFGGPIDTAPFEALAADHGLALVFDQAAGFDNVAMGQYPRVISLHATKVLGAGEGALVLSNREGFIAGFRQRANFGFLGNRQVRVAAVNAKLSEYHAAVALAGFDGWPKRRAELMALAQEYRRLLRADTQIELQSGWGKSWISSTCIIKSNKVVDDIETQLASQKVDSRRWWGNGCHRQPAFEAYGAEPLPETEQLAAHVLGLPFFPDINRNQLERICRLVETP
jgi:dTDP-4-amino-4,6-dideoxygalactose transaminase